MLTYLCIFLRSIIVCLFAKYLINYGTDFKESIRLSLLTRNKRMIMTVISTYIEMQFGVAAAQSPPHTYCEVLTNHARLAFITLASEATGNMHCFQKC